MDETPPPPLIILSREDLTALMPFGEDVEAVAAERFAHEIADTGLDAEVAAQPRDATRASDVIVTCTSSLAPFLGPTDVRPGTFIAAIGADNPDKSEIDPALMARARVVTDLTASMKTGKVAFVACTALPRA
jgi:ornithine cyclodeaminase/alanine dehydrogenase-like protein (mu-crystallin family)